MYNEMGQLTVEGRKSIEQFTTLVKDFLSQSKDENESRIIGSLLANTIGNVVAERIVEQRQK